MAVSTLVTLCLLVILQMIVIRIEMSSKGMHIATYLLLVLSDIYIWVCDFGALHASVSRSDNDHHHH